MGTKSNPAPNDCYTKAEDDEPMFTLLARDPLAPTLVRFWATMREITRGPSDKATEAYECSVAMDRWREAHAAPSDTTPRRPETDANKET